MRLEFMLGIAGNQILRLPDIEGKQVLAYIDLEPSEEGPEPQTLDMNSLIAGDQPIKFSSWIRSLRALGATRLNWYNKRPDGFEMPSHMIEFNSSSVPVIAATVKNKLLVFAGFQPHTSGVIISGLQMSQFLEDQCAGESEKKELWDKVIKQIASQYSQFSKQGSGKEFVADFFHKNNTVSIAESLLSLALDFCVEKSRELNISKNQKKLIFYSPNPSGKGRIGPKTTKSIDLGHCFQFLFTAPATDLTWTLESSYSSFQSVLKKAEIFCDKELGGRFKKSFTYASERLLKTINQEKIFEMDQELADQLKLMGDFARIIAAIQSADVFGGMGSWNDLGIDTQEFDELSDELWQQIHKFSYDCI